jgi:hypothetical protein
MKIDPRLKIEKIAGDRDARRYLNEPYLDVENKCLVATDGHKLVCIPVKVSPDDTSGPVPVAAIMDARKRKLKLAEIVCNGDAMLLPPDGGEPLAHYERVVLGKFPDYSRVLPDPNAKPVVSVCLNAQYLLELAHALTIFGGRGGNRKAPVVRLDIFDDARAVRVTVESEPERTGVVMPCKLTGRTTA